MMTTNFWVSWVCTVEDGRPLTEPPNAAIIGHWISGYDSNDQEIWCAWVRAKDEKQARLALSQDWPELKGKRSWRFFDEQPAGWEPSDRFPAKSKWSRDRRAAIKKGKA